MSPKPDRSKSEPSEERGRAIREAIAEDADQAEGQDRDLVHGEGGTLGLGPGEDLNEDD